jgi:hypothetical protein
VSLLVDVVSPVGVSDIKAGVKFVKGVDRAKNARSIAGKADNVVDAAHAGRLPNDALVVRGGNDVSLSPESLGGKLGTHRQG